jgi:hypothetical protein
MRETSAFAAASIGLTRQETSLHTLHYTHPEDTSIQKALEQRPCRKVCVTKLKQMTGPNSAEDPKRHVILRCDIELQLIVSAA